MTHNIIMMIGIPGCGKTTWAKEYQRTYPNTYIISSDEIRKEVTGTYVCDPTQSSMIHERAWERAREELKEHDVLIDSTNTSLDEWLRYKKLQPYIFIAKIFEIPPEEANKRQMFRERQVPVDVLEHKWEEYQKNKKYLGKVFNILLY